VGGGVRGGGCGAVGGGGGGRWGVMEMKRGKKMKEYREGGR